MLNYNLLLLIFLLLLRLFSNVSITLLNDLKKKKEKTTRCSSKACWQGIEVRQQGECDILTFIWEDDVGMAE